MSSFYIWSFGQQMLKLSGLPTKIIYILIFAALSVLWSS